MNKYFKWGWIGALIAVILSLFVTMNVDHTSTNKPVKEIAVLKAENRALEDLVAKQDSVIQILQKELIPDTKVVKGTVYYPTGHEMRSGKFIPRDYSEESAEPKYCAISQDL